MLGERPAVLGEPGELDLQRRRRQGPLLRRGIFRRAWGVVRCFRGRFRKLRLGLGFAIRARVPIRGSGFGLWLGLGFGLGLGLGLGLRLGLRLGLLDAIPVSSSHVCLASPQLRPNFRSTCIGTSSVTASHPSCATSSAMLPRRHRAFQRVVHLQERHDSLAPAGPHPQLGVARRRALDQRVHRLVGSRRVGSNGGTRDDWGRERGARLPRASTAPCPRSKRSPVLPRRPNADAPHRRARGSPAWQRCFGSARQAAGRMEARGRSGHRSRAPRLPACRSSPRTCAHQRQMPWRS